MIGYAMVGTNDLSKARDFYLALVTVLGGKEALEFRNERRSWYSGAKGRSPLLVVTEPYDGGPATVGNGNMLALTAPSRDAVDAAHAKALELGGKDEGAPGLRGGDFYGAYFRDLDGNKICVFRMGPAL